MLSVVIFAWASLSRQPTALLVYRLAVLQHQRDRAGDAVLVHELLQHPVEPGQPRRIDPYLPGGRFGRGRPGLRERRDGGQAQHDSDERGQSAHGRPHWASTVGSMPFPCVYVAPTAPTTAVCRVSPMSSRRRYSASMPVQWAPTR